MWLEKGRRPGAAGIADEDEDVEVEDELGRSEAGGVGVDGKETVGGVGTSVVGAAP